MEKRKQKMTIRDLCLIGVSAALIAGLAQIRLPLPGGVPMTLQTFAIPLVAIILGKKGAVAAAVYVLLGAVGAPVFAGLTGGFAIIAGPTGGYIVSFPLMALVVGWGASSGSKIKLAVCLALGSIINLGMGTVWLCMSTDLSLWAAFLAGTAPFLVVEAVKMNLAYQVGFVMRRAVGRIGASETA